MGSRLFLMLAIAVLFGIAIGRLSASNAPARAATAETTDPAGATQTAEREELTRLRTQVAQTPVAPVCTPPPTETPEPSPSPTPVPTLVPPAAAGQPVPYGEGWTVTVLDIVLLPNFEELKPQGVFAKISLTITNNGVEQRKFPYDDLVLRDAQGRPFVTPHEFKIHNASGWFDWFPPSLPTDGFVVFDVATDALGPFILESTTDPMFRIEVSPQSRG